MAATYRFDHEVVEAAAAVARAAVVVVAASVEAIEAEARRAAASASDDQNVVESAGQASKGCRHRRCKVDRDHVQRLAIGPAARVPHSAIGRVDRVRHSATGRRAPVGRGHHLEIVAHDRVALVVQAVRAAHDRALATGRVARHR